MSTETGVQSVKQVNLVECIFISDRNLQALARILAFWGSAGPWLRFFLFDEKILYAYEPVVRSCSHRESQSQSHSAILFWCCPHGLAFTWLGCLSTKLAHLFLSIFFCPSAYRNLSAFLLFSYQILPTHLQFSCSDYHFCLHQPSHLYFSFLLFSFWNFSFSLWSASDLEHNSCGSVSKTCPKGGSGRRGTCSERLWRRNKTFQGKWRSPVLVAKPSRRRKTYLKPMNCWGRLDRFKAPRS